MLTPRATSCLPLLCIFLAALLPAAVCAQTYYVATTGVDQPGNGTQTNPWASISYAIGRVSDGATIEVAPGTYNGRVRLGQAFNNGVLIRSTQAYRARLRYNAGAVVICFTCRGVTLEGFDIAHSTNNVGGLVIQIQNNVIGNVTLRNNIIHDSTDNDLLKINNGANDVLVEGNLFYNQAGSDEHIDINSATNITVRDNVFFNTGSQAVTSSYIVIKDSNANSDGILGAQNIAVQRNVFFNWQGSDGQSFVRVGEDGTPNFEASDVLIENNLMLGNSNRLMRSAFTLQGSRNVRFRSNTVVGNLPSRSFAARLLAIGSNQANQNIVLSNNIWSDPSGSMGAEGFNGADVFDAPIGDNQSITLNNNLYYNGSNAIPADVNQEVNVADDNNAVMGNPRLPSQNGLSLPTFNGTDFGQGLNSVRAVFVDLVMRYGRPANNSAARNRADNSDTPADDILGNTRDGSADIGAFEIGGTVNPPAEPPPPNNNTVLTWLLLLLAD